MIPSSKFSTTFQTCSITDPEKVKRLRLQINLWNNHANELDAYCCREKQKHPSKITNDIAMNVLCSYTVANDLSNYLKIIQNKLKESNESCIVAITESGSIESVAVISSVAQEILLLATNPRNLNVPDYPQGKQVRGASLAVISHILHQFTADSVVRACVHRSAQSFYEKIGFSISEEQGKWIQLVPMQTLVKNTLDILSTIPFQTTCISESKVTI